MSQSLRTMHSHAVYPAIFFVQISGSVRVTRLADGGLWHLVCECGAGRAWEKPWPRRPHQQAAGIEHSETERETQKGEESSQGVEHPTIKSWCSVVNKASASSGGTLSSQLVLILNYFCHGQWQCPGPRLAYWLYTVHVLSLLPSPSPSPRTLPRVRSLSTRVLCPSLGQG